MAIGPIGSVSLEQADTADVGTCLFDTELRYLQIDPRFAAINGLSVEAHLGRTIGEVVPDGAARVEPLLRGVMKTGKPIVDGLVRAETALGALASLIDASTKPLTATVAASRGQAPTTMALEPRPRHVETYNTQEGGRSMCSNRNGVRNLLISALVLGLLSGCADPSSPSTDRLDPFSFMVRPTPGSAMMEFENLGKETLYDISVEVEVEYQDASVRKYQVRVDKLQPGEKVTREMSGHAQVFKTSVRGEAKVDGVRRDIRYSLSGLDLQHVKEVLDSSE